jgi:hypothetical protein
MARRRCWLVAVADVPAGTFAMCFGWGVVSAPVTPEGELVMAGKCREPSDPSWVSADLRLTGVGIVRHDHPVGLGGAARSAPRMGLCWRTPTGELDAWPVATVHARMVLEPRLGEDHERPAMAFASHPGEQLFDEPPRAAQRVRASVAVADGRHLPSVSTGREEPGRSGPSTLMSSILSTPESIPSTSAITLRPGNRRTRRPVRQPGRLVDHLTKALLRRTFETQPRTEPGALCGGSRLS